MEPIALTRACELIHVTNSIERLGASPEQVLAQAGLPMWHFCSPDDLIPTRHIYALMEQAARHLDTPNFGLLVGAENALAGLGTLGKLVAGASTTLSAFETRCRLIHTHSYAARNWLTAAGDEVWFCCNRASGQTDGGRQMEQWIVMQLIGHVGLATGPAWRPSKIRLQTHQAPGPALRKALRDPEIRIGQQVTAIAVPRALLAQPLRWRSETAPNRQVDEARLQKTAPAGGFIESLRQLAATLLHAEGPPRIEIMAEITNLSVRTLQRRLARFGVTHFEIVDQARFQAATCLLNNSQIAITDIAMDLGYADSAHFTRAFKRWAGVTPRTYRGHQTAF